MSNPPIAFGIMTATENPAAVAQLIEAIGPGHPVFVHHDYSKQPAFRLSAPNVQFIEQPMNTGWGTWGFVQGVLLLMKTALTQSNSAYFQLLSGTCLPIRPVADLVESIDRQTAPINADMMNLDEDTDALMSFGFRAFSPEDSMRFRILRRMRGLYFGPDRNLDLVQQHSLSMRVRASERRGVLRGSVPNLARLVMRAARSGIGFRHPFANGSITPYIGSTWFGCRREIGQRLIERPHGAALEAFAGSLHACDEIYLPSSLANLGVPIAQSNHHVSPFSGAHPRTIGPEDLPTVMASGRFFARKFSNDPRDAARQQILNWLRSHDASPAAMSRSPA